MVGSTIFVSPGSWGNNLLCTDQGAIRWSPVSTQKKMPGPGVQQLPGGGCLTSFYFCTCPLCFAWVFLSYLMTCSVAQARINMFSRSQAGWAKCHEPKAPSPTLMKKMTFGNLHPYVLRSSGKTLGLAAKKNVVKWLELAHSVECIRFVYNNAATMARCSRNKMKGKKNIMVKQSRTVYQDVTVETGSAWKNARVLVTFSLKNWLMLFSPWKKLSVFVLEIWARGFGNVDMVENLQCLCGSPARWISFQLLSRRFYSPSCYQQHGCIISGANGLYQTWKGDRADMHATTMKNTTWFLVKN